MQSTLRLGSNAEEQLAFHAQFHDRLSALLGDDHNNPAVPRNLYPLTPPPPFSSSSSSCTRKGTTYSEGVAAAAAADGRVPPTPTSRRAAAAAARPTTEMPPDHHHYSRSSVDVNGTFSRLERIEQGDDMHPAEVTSLLREVEAALASAVPARGRAATTPGRQPSPGSAAPRRVHRETDMAGASPASPSAGTDTNIGVTPIAARHESATRSGYTTMEMSPEAPSAMPRPSSTSGGARVDMEEPTMGWYYTFYEWMRYYQEVYGKSLADGPQYVCPKHQTCCAGASGRGAPAVYERHHGGGCGAVAFSIPPTLPQSAAMAGRTSTSCSDSSRDDALYDALSELRQGFQVLAQEVERLRGDKILTGQQQQRRTAADPSRAYAADAQRGYESATASSASKVNTNSGRSSTSSSVYERKRAALRAMRPAWRNH